MTIIKIAPNENGSHDNQTINYGVDWKKFPIPEGWAYVPDDLLPLENFPFGEAEVTDIGNGVGVVIGWKPLPVPELEPGPAEPQYTEIQILGQQVTDLELMILGGGVSRV